jgi:hypothetical protein
VKGEAPKSIGKAVKDKAGPKKNLSAYFFFAQDQRQAVKEENPELKTVGQVAKVLGSKWQALSAEEKETYEARAAEDKERYQRQLVEAGSTPGGSAKAKTKAKEGGAGGGAKRPLTAFFRYANEARAAVKEMHPEAKLGEVAKILGTLYVIYVIYVRVYS